LVSSGAAEGRTGISSDRGAWAVSRPAPNGGCSFVPRRLAPTRPRTRATAAPAIHRPCFRPKRPRCIRQECRGGLATSLCKTLRGRGLRRSRDVSGGVTEAGSGGDADGLEGSAAGYFPPYGLPDVRPLSKAADGPGPPGIDRIHSHDDASQRGQDGRLRRFTRKQVRRHAVRKEGKIGSSTGTSPSPRAAQQPAHVSATASVRSVPAWSLVGSFATPSGRFAHVHA
jgi:hypothetical protein